MPENSTLLSSQLLQLSSDFNDLGDGARGALSNQALTPNQSNVISSDMTTLYNTAGNLATWGAQVVFADSDAAFNTISSATKSGATALQQLQADVAKVNSVINILGAAIALGVAFGSGNPGTILQSAGKLATAVSSA